MRRILFVSLSAAILAGCSKRNNTPGDESAPPPEENGPAVVTAKRTAMCKPTSQCVKPA